jgi:filamentous hemagglutinin
LGDAAKVGKYGAKGLKAVKLWSKGPEPSSVHNAFKHFLKHGDEFSDVKNAKQYVEKAHKFVSDPPPGTLTKVRPNGEKLFYDPNTNTFAAQAADGAPKTMFKPENGMDYWNNQ